MSKNKVEWEWKKLGEVCEVIAGQSPKGSSYNNNEEGMEFHQGKKAFGNKVIGSSGIWTNEITKVAEPKDILISVRAPVGPVNFTDRKICIGRGLAVIRPQNIDSEYIYHFLVYNESKLNCKSGAVFDSISRDDIKNFEIPVPPLAEQKRIVNVLDETFEKIEKIKANAQANLQNAKDLFRGILKKDFSTNNWESKTLQEVCSMKIKDGTHQTPTYCDKSEGYPFISSKDVTTESISWENIKYIIPQLHEELYKKIAPQKDDVLLAKNGTTGVAAIVEDDRIFDIYVTLAVLRPNQEIIFPRYLLRIVNSPICKVQFDSHLKGSGVPNLHLNEIQKVQIPLPPLPIQKQVVAKLDSLSEKVKQLESNYKQILADCEELKKAVLKKAFNGNL